MGKDRQHLKREFRKSLDGLVKSMWDNVELGLQNPYYQNLRVATEVLEEHNYEVTKYQAIIYEYIKKSR